LVDQQESDARVDSKINNVQNFAIAFVSRDVTARGMSAT